MAEFMGSPRNQSSSRNFITVNLWMRTGSSSSMPPLFRARESCCSTVLISLMSGSQHPRRPSSCKHDAVNAAGQLRLRGGFLQRGKHADLEAQLLQLLRADRGKRPSWNAASRATCHVSSTVFINRGVSVPTHPRNFRRGPRMVTNTPCRSPKMPAAAWPVFQPRCGTPLQAERRATRTSAFPVSVTSFSRAPVSRALADAFSGGG